MLQTCDIHASFGSVECSIRGCIYICQRDGVTYLCCIMVDLIELRPAYSGCGVGCDEEGHYLDHHSRY